MFDLPIRLLSLLAACSAAPVHRHAGRQRHGVVARQASIVGDYAGDVVGADALDATVLPLLP